jgi:hypothetical protein
MQHRDTSILLAAAALAALVMASASCSSSPDASGPNEDSGSPRLDSGTSTPVADSGGSLPPLDSGTGSTPAPDGGAGGSTDGGSPGSDAGQTPGGDAGVDPTFTAVYTAILAPTCSSHHAGAGGSLDLSSQASAYTNLVGVHAGGACGTGAGGPFTRVVAGDAHSSLLYLKVAGTPPCGAQMPRGGPPLSSDQVALIAGWINAGAQNN